MRIKQTVERVPGGLMTVPLAIGAVLTTLAPRMGDFFGSFTGALFTGALPILAVFYVCIGATIRINALLGVLKRGGALLSAKIGLGICSGALLGHFLGTQPVQAGWFAGLSTLAVVASINDTNGGLYMALMRRYGTPEDVAAYSLMAIESGPFLTMITLGVAGLSAFPWQTMTGAILPLCVGMLLGNLDTELREFLGDAAPVLIPFFAFSLGTSLNLHLVWSAGILGAILGVAILLISAAVMIGVDRLIGGNGTAGVAAATTAGNAAAVPMLIAASDPQYAAAAKPATVLVAASVVVTGLLAPFLTAFWHRWVNRQKA